MTYGLTQTNGAGIVPAVVTLSQSGGSVAVNAALGNDFRLTLTASGWTIANPSNPVDGQGIVFVLTQDATGSRTLTWGSAYNFGAGGAPTLSTAANAIDVLGFIYDSAISKWVYAGGGGASSASELSEFPVSAYGAKGDGRIVTDGAMTASGTTLTCATSTPFTPADVGKFVLVWKAGPLAPSAAGGSNMHLFTHITAFTDSGHVTVNDAAVATVSGVGVLYGTDDTAAIQAAIDAAVTYAQLGSGREPEVQFEDLIYCIAGAPSTARFGNAQLTLPVISPTSGVKVPLRLQGEGAAQPLHWTQPQPVQGGTILMGMRTDGSLSGTNGATTVIGGPVNGYGGGGGLFSNMELYVDGIGIMVPVHNLAYSGMDLYGVGQCNIGAFSYMPLAVTVAASAIWPSLNGSDATWMPSYNYGLCMPAIGNNAETDIDTYTCYQAQIALIPGEHTTCRSLKTIYCAFGLVPMGSAGGAPCHGAQISYWTCEAGAWLAGTVTSGHFAAHQVYPLVVSMASLEMNRPFISDAANLLVGTVWFDDLGATQYYSASVYTGSSNLKVLHLGSTMAGPVSSPQAAPATTVAWPNRYYQDAEITLSVAAGTLSALTITGIGGTAVSQTVPASSTFYRFTLPSGASYTPTYTGTLTHTVTLI
jgi:hypothetical protein